MEEIKIQVSHVIIYSDYYGDRSDLTITFLDGPLEDKKDEIKIDSDFVQCD